MLKNGDQQHDGEAQQDAGVLQQEEAAVAEAVVPCVVMQHLRHHVHQSHVQEEPGCDGEYPHGDVLRVVSDQDTSHHAQVGRHGRQHVVQNGLTHRHPGLQEHRKVT